MSRQVIVDLDLLDEAGKVYDSEINKLKEALDTLSSAVEELRASAWKTNGSDEFFKNYDDTWKVKLKEHIEYLEHLRDCLASAQAGFRGQYQRNNTLYL